MQSHAYSVKCFSVFYDFFPEKIKDRFLTKVRVVSQLFYKWLIRVIYSILSNNKQPTPLVFLDAVILNETG